MLFTFLTVVQALVATALVATILMQQSEGGGLGTGGNPSGLMSARGASNFLSRSTSVLATIFVALSILLAALAINVTGGRELDTSLQRNAPVQAPVDPLAGSTNPGAAAPVAAPDAPAPANDPLAGSAAN